MQKKIRLLVFLGLFCFAVVLNAAAKDDSYIEKIANKAGVECYEKGKYDEAIDWFTKAINKNPDYAAAYCNRGLAYTLKNNPDKAIDDFNKAIQLNPDYAQAYNGRAVAYIDKGDRDQAISDFSRAIKLKPNYFESLELRAGVYAVMKQYDKAWQDVHKAQALGRQVNSDFLTLLKKASGRNK